jgi:hypothetical protein
MLGVPHYSDNTKVGGCSLGETNGNLELLELGMALRILHFLQNDALLHLTDIFFLNNSEEVFERGKDLIRV